MEEETRQNRLNYKEKLNSLASGTRSPKNLTHANSTANNKVGMLISKAVAAEAFFLMFNIDDSLHCQFFLLLIKMGRLTLPIALVAVVMGQIRHA